MYFEYFLYMIPGTFAESFLLSPKSNLPTTSGARCEIIIT